MRDTRPRLGVAVLVADLDADGALRYLLGCRARGPHAGLWVIPGGGVELGESCREAGARELREETGLDVELTGSRPEHVMEIRGSRSHRVCLVYRGRLLGTSTVRCSDELSAARWFAPAGLAALDEAGGISPPVREALVAMRVL